MTMNEYFGALEPKVKSRVHINTPARLELGLKPNSSRNLKLSASAMNL